MPDPISAWALAVLALLTLTMMLCGLSAIYQIKTYHLLNESSSYTTAPLVPDEQAV